MLLSLFIVTQIALDIALVGFVMTLTRRRWAPAPARRTTTSKPPAWYGDVLAMIEELMVLVEPVLELADRGALGPRPTAAVPDSRAVETTRDRHRAAMALLRSGAAPEEVARRERLLPGELRLLRNLVTAEAELAGTGGR
ncbi:MAG TPA: hypothetical protein VMI34_14475 [Candidatus Bathyarchaeia archaeon]|nr:hypothetical protein [Candidatus Bathyarchaeia archaeon]